MLEVKSDFVIDGRLKFTNNTAFFIIDFQHNSHKYIMINATSGVDINQNCLCTLFTTTTSVRANPYPYCFFQYISPKNLDSNIEYGKYSIGSFYNHYNKRLCMLRNLQNTQRVPTTNCQWLPQSSYSTSLPLDVNNKYIQYTDSTGTYNRLPHVNEPNTLCVCTNISHYDCSITDGQTLNIPLYYYTKEHNNPNVVISIISQPDIPLCTVLDVNQHRQTLDNQSQCTLVNYTIVFPTNQWCELYIKVVLPMSDNVNLFTVRQHMCPPEFTNIDGICQCHALFSKHGIVQCYISDQTILRAPNSWIITTKNNSDHEIYHISLHCPFHYCVPHSSYLNLLNPNSQYQFNRCGILCGQCQHGLSTVFGSSHCQHCSNI